jgi:ABC-2 type transport system ATP-binding protein
MKEAIIRAHGLTRIYGRHRALNGVDITVNRGDIYGLIGRNGAGKTTMLKIFTGLTIPDEGSYELFGKESEQERGRIGCLIDFPAFFGNLSAHDNLKYYCILKGITDLSKIDTALERVGLTNTGRKKYRNFSLGMKQRLGIALAILDEPELLILDEPINGLDPIGISDMRDLFIKLNEELGITIVISSHILSELYTLAGRFIFIEEGRILKDVSKEELDEECKVSINITCNDLSRAAAVLEEQCGIRDYKITDDRTLKVYDDVDEIFLQDRLREEGIGVMSAVRRGISLEDYFKMLVGGKANG